MSEITIPLIFFIILVIGCLGSMTNYIFERIDKTLNLKLQLEKEKTIKEMDSKELLK